MTEIPPPQDNIPDRIYGVFQANQEPPRPHLGLSQIGHPCDRWLWLSWRWAIVEKFPGRILRLFRRGQDEEARLIEDLRAAGLVVSEADEQGRQHGVRFSAHLSGSMDGIIESGVPEAPHKPHIFEAKTHSTKSFSDLCKKGVQKSKFQHFAQCQTYMHGKGIDRALYVAVNKDDDSIYVERIRYDKDVAEKLVERGHRIVASDRMPEPVSSDPSWYQCKMCPAHALCHKSALPKEVNCRTCLHATAGAEGWHCERWGAAIPEDVQRTGCDSHAIHPDLVPWKMLDSPDGVTAAYEIDGQRVLVGEGGVSSTYVLGL